MAAYKYTDSQGVRPKEAEKVLKAFRYAQDSFLTARQDSEKAVRYLNNDSWTDTEKSNATKYKKPTLKYNIITPIIATLVGNEQLNRRRAKFRPTTIDGVDICNTIQGRWNAIVDEQDFEDKLQIAFTDALTTKLGGWIERAYVLNEEGYLEFKYNVLNNFRVWVDPETRANDYALEHCRWIIKEGWEPLDVIVDKYSIPTDDMEREKDRYWWDSLSQIFKRFTNSTYSSGAENYDKENDRYRILEMQERRTIKVYKVYADDEYVVMTKEELDEARELNPNITVVMKFNRDVIYLTTIIPYFGDLVVRDQEIIQPVANFDVFPVWSYNYNVQVNEQTSLVDLLLDIQDDVNKAKSQARDYVTQILSGGVFIDKREKETIKALKEKGNQPNMVYELNNPALMPQKMPPSQIPPDVLTNSENSVAFAQRVSLVSEAMKGETARSGESGVLFEQKVQRAAAAINPYFKNLSRIRKVIAKDFVDNFAFVYAEEDRIIGIKEENVFKQVILNLNLAGRILMNTANPSVFVELDEGENNVTNVEDNFNKMLALSNVIGQVNPAFVDIRTLVASAPISGSEKMVEFIDQMLQSQSESSQEQAGVAQNQQNIEDTKKLLENEKIKRGMMNDEEKLKLESEKIRQQGLKERVK